MWPPTAWKPVLNWRNPYNAAMQTDELSDQPILDDATPADAAPISADEDVSVTQEYVIRHDLQKRVDLYLRDRLPGYSRAMLQKLIKNEALQVNGRVAKASTVLRGGDTVTILLPPRAPETALPENIPLQVVYEDDDFLAVNKQAGLLVHPSRGHWTGTLINALLFHAQETAGTLSTGSDPWRPGIIHRLDRDTTGLILIAKTDEAHWRLAGQFERRTIQKTYLALVHGQPVAESDLIDAPLAVHSKVREKYAVRPDIGRPSQTIYHVKRRLGEYALLEFQPRTGRTHQLRVHSAFIGHPIVGDTMYGGRPISQRDIMRNQTGDEHPLISRQALHAWRLQFVHPTKFHRMVLEAPVPPDFERLLAYVTAYGRARA